MLRIVKDFDEEKPLFSLSFWTYMEGNRGIFSRIAAAFRVLRYGYSDRDIVLDEESVRTLALVLGEEVSPLPREEKASLLTPYEAEAPWLD